MSVRARYKVTERQTGRTEITWEMGGMTKAEADRTAKRLNGYYERVRHMPGAIYTYLVEADV